VSRFDVVELFANPRVLPSAIAPLCGPIFVPLLGVSIDWAFAAVPACVVTIVVVVQLLRQSRMEKPAKIWRGTPWLSFVIDVGMLVVATLGLLYAVAPWRPEVEVRQVMIVGGGFAIAGTVITLALGPVLAKQRKGPFKRAKSVGWGWFGVVMYALMIAPMIGGMAGMFASGLYIEEVVSGGPAALTREGWCVLLTMLCGMPVFLLWCYVDLRRRLRKQR
jgi:hypothetical protein